MIEASPFLIALIAFTAVATAVFVIGRYFATEVRIQQRAGAPANAVAMPTMMGGVEALVSTYFDEKRFGVEGSYKSKLRRDLIRAGFFHSNAISYYIFARVAVVLALPTVSYLAVVVLLPGASRVVTLGVVVIAAFLGLLGPDAFIARRQRILVQRYRLAFPDLLDLLVVCVDAGLSLEAALEKITPEIVKKTKELGMNLLMMGAERRAGRSTIEALQSLSERLGLAESRSLVGMLRQSIELGTDVAEALRVFSDEMRDRRLLRAEEKAGKLPVKMVLPLGLCIFPVILLLTLFPVVIRLMTVMSVTK